MRHLFLVDPLPRLSLMKDTTVVFMREAARRGHGVFTAQVDALGVGEDGRPTAHVSETALRAGLRFGDSPRARDAAETSRALAPWYELGPGTRAFLDAFDVVWMRKDPPVDLEFMRCLQILCGVAPTTLVVNDPGGVLSIDEKLFAMRFPELGPATRVSRDPADLLAFRAELGGEMIVKPIGGCGGEGVFHIVPGERNLRALLELLTAGGTRLQIAQAYLPAIRAGDKRVIVLDGEPIGAVLRVPAEGETRANFHAGGSARKADVTDRDREICARIGPELRARGIVFAGIDVIGEHLTEINVTSPTGVQEINALCGVALEHAVMDSVEQRAARARGSR
jgi:glutathione synthase